MALAFLVHISLQLYNFPKDSHNLIFDQNGNVNFNGLIRTVENL